MSPRKTRRGVKDGNNDTLSETISKKSAVDTPTEIQPKMRTRRQITKANSLESEGDQSPEPSINKSTRKTVAKTPSKSRQSRKTLNLDTTALDESVMSIAKPKRSRKGKENEILVDQSVLSESTTLDESVMSITKPKRTRKGKENEILVDQSVLSESITLDESVMGITKPKRTRKGKEKETLVDQSVLLETTTLDESSAKVNKSRVGKSRKKADSKVSGEEKPARRINASAAKNVTILESGIDSTGNDSTDPMSSEDTEVLQVSTRISRVKATAASLAASPLTGNRRSRPVKQRLEDFTPESSPITVNLTPHRTTKTPRKSPMNLSSPKSHADAPQRLSKTPRKLPVVVDSPAPSEMSVTSSSNSTPENSINPASEKAKKSRKSRKSPGKSPRKSPAIVVAVRKFSKSPKIVLRSPKPKSAKSTTPTRLSSKAKRSSPPKRSPKSPPKPMKSSPRKTSVSTEEAINSPKSSRRSVKVASKSVVSPGDLMSVHLARIDSPKARETKLEIVTKKGTPDAQSLATKKLPTATESPEIPTRNSLRRTPADSPKTTPAMSPGAQKRSSQGGESPPRAKTTGQKRGAFTDSGTPLRPIDSPWASVNSKAAAGKSMILSSSETPVDVRTKTASGIGGRMTASTPRERTRRSLNLSPGAGNPLILATSPMNGEVPAGSSTMISGGRPKRRSARLDDESNPLISEDESFSPRPGASPLNGTYEVEKDATVVPENEQETSANGTYELAEPKTPNLRSKAGKRSLGDLDDSFEERSVKRICRVRFASPELDPAQERTIGAVTGRSRSATPRHRFGTKQTHHTTPISGIDKDNKGNVSRRRSSSMTNVSLVKTPVAEKRRSNSASDANARSAVRKAQTESVNRLSKPRITISSAKKTEAKSPAARKTPNFARIHQKQFAKMESLVDAKKRVEKRHVAMVSQIPTIFPRAVKSKLPTASKPAVTTQPIAPIVAVNGAYNRYGFKLRKDEAIKMVTQKQPALISQKKQNDNRMFLKGVRTNRRFDLIMKARKIDK